MTETMITSPPRRPPPASTPASPAPRPAIELVGPAQKQRGIQLPQLLVSLLVVAVTALLVLWWNTSTSARRPVLALATDVSQGSVIEADDLVTVYVSADGPIQASGEQFASVFVGSVVRSDFLAGTLVVGEMFQQSAPLDVDEALVGLLLDANQYPPGLAAGDSAEVLVLTAGSESSTLATVETVQVSSGDAWVRIRVDRADAAMLQRAAAANQVAVVKVAVAG